MATLAPVIGDGTIDHATVVNAGVRSRTEAALFVVPAQRNATKSPGSSDSRSGQHSTDGRARDWTGLAPPPQGLLIGISHRDRQP